MEQPAHAPWFAQRRVTRVAPLSMALLLVIVSWLAFRSSATPGPSIGWDKLDHFAAFAMLALNAVLVWRYESAAGIAAALWVYGVLIELVQTQIPGRSGEVGDVVADALGITIGLALAGLMFQRRSSCPLCPGASSAWPRHSRSTVSPTRCRRRSGSPSGAKTGAPADRSADPHRPVL